MDNLNKDVVDLVIENADFGDWTLVDYSGAEYSDGIATVKLFIDTGESDDTVVFNLGISVSDFGVYSVSCDAMTNIEYVENLLNN